MKMSRIFEQGVFLLLSACTLAILGSCGSGAVSGPPATDPAAGTPLAVSPPTADLFADLPTTFTVTGGKSGYTAFSSNSAVLPVTASVTGSTFSVIPNPVTADTVVDITVRDAANTAATAKATVKPSSLNNQVTFTPLSPTGSGCGTGLCSGGDAQVVVKAVLNGVVLRSRAIRFDAYQGNFQIVTPGSGTLVNSLIVNTDEQGEAVVRIFANATAPTQVATLQSTDVSSGLSRRFNFNIIQATSGTGILTTLPSGAITVIGAKGPPGGSGFCPGGTVDFYVFGGTPPYTVVSPLPSVARISSGSVVSASGGGFSAQIQGCGKVSMIVSDSSGRTVETSQIDSQQGADGDAVTTTTTSLKVAPLAVSVGCGLSATISLAGNGVFTANTVTAGVAATAFYITPTSGTIPATLTLTRVKDGVAATATPSTILVNVVAGSTIETVTVTTAPTCP